MLTLYRKLRPLAQCVSRNTAYITPHAPMNRHLEVSWLDIITHITRLGVLLVSRVHIFRSKIYLEGDVLWQLHGSLVRKLLRRQIEPGRKFSLLGLQ